MLAEAGFVLGLVAFLAAWLAMSRHLSRASGWVLLAPIYPQQIPEDGPRLRFRSGLLGSVRYRRILRLTVGRSYLHLAVPFPFRFHHPPLSIPWSDISLVTERPFATLGFSRTPGAELRIDGRLARRIREASDGRLRGS